LTQLKPGDVVIIDAPGGGGYGHPFERDLELVAEDLRDGYVSGESARTDYGVVINSATQEIDEKETDKLRGKA
jgi:N-methylhydantoinase B